MSPQGGSTVTFPATKQRPTRVDQIADAAVAFFSEGRFDCTMRDIARRAGVSTRTARRHLGSASQLRDAAVSEAIVDARHVGSVRLHAYLPMQERAARVVGHHLRVYEALALIFPVVRTNTATANSFSDLQVGMSERLARHFGAELEHLDEPERIQRLATIDLQLQPESIDHLRRIRSMSFEAIGRLLVEQLTNTLNDIAATKDRISVEWTDLAPIVADEAMMFDRFGGNPESGSDGQQNHDAIVREFVECDLVSA